MNYRRWCRFLVGLLMGTWVPFASCLAHSSSNSYLMISEGQTQLSLRLDVHLRDVDLVFDLDQNRDGQVVWREVEQQRQAITQWLLQGVEFRQGDHRCEWGGADLQASQRSDGFYLSLLGDVNCSAERRDGLILQYQLLFDRDPLHRGVVKIERGETISTALLSPEQPEVMLDRTGFTPWRVALRYGIEGVWHIWLGFDHVLFLISLLLLAPWVQIPQRSGEPAQPATFKFMTWDVLKVVTAFTLAHSITLVMSVLQVIQPPASIVEPVIALSVGVAAFNNLLGNRSVKRWPLALLFGLIHGFGFASVLADLGLPTQAKVLALATFNVGVEAGQLAIVLVFLPVAWALRFTLFYRRLVQVTSLFIGLVGIFWMFERMGLLATFALPS